VPQDLESSGKLNAEPIIYGFPNPLVASQVFLRCLHGHMAEQELDLFQFSSRIVAESGTRSPEIVRSEFENSQSFRVFLDNVSDYFLCNLSVPQTTPLRQTHLKILPRAISATVNQSSIVCFTQLGMGTVRMWPPFPTRSTMAQWSSRR
jgi:hypothetical protein